MFYGRRMNKETFGAVNKNFTIILVTALITY